MNKLIDRWLAAIPLVWILLKWYMWHMTNRLLVDFFPCWSVNEPVAWAWKINHMMNMWWRRRATITSKWIKATAWTLSPSQARAHRAEHMTGMSATRWSKGGRWQKVGNRELEEGSRGEQLPCGPHYFPAVNFTCIFSPLSCRLEGRMLSLSLSLFLKLKNLVLVVI